MTAVITFPAPVRHRKLLPPRLDERLVARPRLMARLDESLQRQLALVVAPAGFGKTTVIAQWLASIPTRAAWLTLDQDDSDAYRFVSHFMAAIQSLTSLAGVAVLDLLQSPAPIPLADIGATLADDLFSDSEEILLVLDDSHAVTSADSFNFLAQFLALAPSRIHLVLASRTDLPLALARLRSQGQVNDLRAAELSFTNDEARDLVTAISSVEVNPSLVARLQEQTEGWVTGLILAAQALGTIRDADSIAEAPEGRQHVMQFLVEEVLANQDLETQDFLLRTSLTDTFCARLADALIEVHRPDGSYATLDWLVQSGLFVEPAGDEPGWFRYHPLFRQLLRHQAAIRFAPDTIVDLHRRAAQWYAREDLIDDAITHLIAAGDLQGCALLVEHCAHRMLAREDWVSVARWVGLLPDELIHEHPSLLLARGWVAHLSGRAAPLQLILAETEELLDRFEIGPEAVASFRAESDVLGLATLLPIEQRPEDILHIARHAIAHLTPDHRFAIGLAHGYIGLALQALGQDREAIRYLEGMAQREAERIDAGSIRALLGLAFLHRQTANYANCAEVARHLLTLAERHDLFVTAGWAHVFLGWLAYERDDLEEAKSHFSAVMADYRHMHMSCIREAMFGMALALQAQGQPLAADSTVQRLIEIVIDAAALEHLPTVLGFEARLALLRQELAPALQWVATADVSIESNTLFAFEHALLTKAEVLLAQGSRESLEEAAYALEVLETRATKTHHLARLAEILAVTALVRDAQGQPDAALDALRRSLDIAERGAFYRTFVDLGPPLRSLLDRAKAQLAMTPLLERLLAALDNPATSLTAQRGSSLSVLKLLTLRESEVLDCLGRRLSYREIADELFISTGTVKRHVGNIYSKLGVGSRREALVMAQSLGWQPGS